MSLLWVSLRLKFRFLTLHLDRILGFHCLVGAKLLNTLSNGALCTTTFSAIAAIICFLFSLPRTLKQMSFIGVFSAATMGIAVLLAVIFSGVQDFPAGFNGVPPLVTAFPVKGSTYISGTSFQDSSPCLP